MEGSQTGVLLLGAFFAADGKLDSSTACQTAGFWLGLFALFLPIFEKVYDAIISQVDSCVRGTFDPIAFVAAFVSLLLTIPGVVMAYIGMGNDELDTAAGAMDEATAALEIAAVSYTHLTLPTILRV